MTNRHAACILKLPLHTHAEQAHAIRQEPSHGVVSMPVVGAIRRGLLDDASFDGLRDSTDPHGATAEDPSADVLCQNRYAKGVFVNKLDLDPRLIAAEDRHPDCADYKPQRFSLWHQPFVKGGDGKRRQRRLGRLTPMDSVTEIPASKPPNNTTPRPSTNSGQTRSIWPFILLV